MQFLSAYFWLFLFALLLIDQVVLRKFLRLRTVVLLLVSVGIVVLWDRWLSLFFVLSILVSYFCGRAIGQSNRKTTFLVIGVTFHTIALIAWKASFAWLPLVAPAGPSLLLPIGVSFYTFQILSYLIDVWKGTQPAENDFITFAASIAFFPKLFSGPIERVNTLAADLRQPKTLDAKLLSESMFLIVWGAVQKFAIADNAWIYSHLALQPTGPDKIGWLTGSLGIMLAIYADFSGYSDIARGIGKLLGVELSVNFRIPYLARTPSEFWERWHITLSKWVREYLYFPLGGSRGGYGRTYFNLLLIMLVMGLWDGLQWSFVCWGLYQGALLVFYHLVRDMNGKRGMLTQILGSTIVGLPLFFCLTAFGWILFEAPSLSVVSALLHGPILGPMDGLLGPILLGLWLPVVAMNLWQEKRADLLALAHLPLVRQLPFYILAFYLLVALPPATPHQFIYVQF